MVKQLFQLWCLVSLNATSHVLNGIGNAFTSTASLLNVSYIQATIRYDNEYGLKEWEIEEHNASLDNAPNVVSKSAN